MPPVVWPGCVVRLWRLAAARTSSSQPSPALGIARGHHAALACVGDARVAPTDIEQLHVGQAATVSLNAFDMRETPQLNGRVLRVSPDLSEDQRTGASYYTVRIALSDAEIARLDGKQLVPLPTVAGVAIADQECSN